MKEDMIYLSQLCLQYYQITLVFLLDELGWLYTKKLLISFALNYKP